MPRQKHCLLEMQESKEDRRKYWLRKRLPIHLIILSGIMFIVIGVVFEFAILAIAGYLATIGGFLLLGAKNKVLGKTIDTAIQAGGTSELHETPSEMASEEMNEKVTEMMREEWQEVKSLQNQVFD